MHVFKLLEMVTIFQLEHWFSKEKKLFYFILLIVAMLIVLDVSTLCGLIQILLLHICKHNSIKNISIPALPWMNASDAPLTGQPLSAYKSTCWGKNKNRAGIIDTSFE